MRQRYEPLPLGLLRLLLLWLPLLLLPLLLLWSLPLLKPCCCCYCCYSPLLIGASESTGADALAWGCVNRDSSGPAPSCANLTAHALA